VLRRNRFNHNGISEFPAHPEPSITDLANQVAVPQQQAHSAFLAQAQLPQALAQLRRSQQLLDAYTSTWLDSTEPAN
jgi:hypothetical protein